MRLAMGRQSACKAADDGNGSPAFLALLFRRNAVPDLAMDQQFSVAVVLPGDAPNLTPRAPVKTATASIVAAGSGTA